MNKAKITVFLIADTVLLSVFVFCLFNYSLILYGLSQGKGQLQLIYNTREVSEVLKDPAVHDTIKSRLRLIAEIKKYAIDSLGIKPNDNYTTFYNQPHKPRMWVVTAASPYRMQAYEWQFSFLGKFSYKGFFNRQKALQEKERLERQGYDTDLGTASAWSTLGWLRDPILPGMLKKSEGQLANLIIHEMTHGTLYVKNNVDFNENLASFIGHEGALRFLKFKYGADSPEMHQYLEDRADEKLFNDYILSGVSRLEEFYTQPEQDTAVLKPDKKKIIHEIVEGLSELPLKNKKRYAEIMKEALVSGNAFFMSYYRYEVKMKDFEEELNTKFNSELHSYLSFLVKNNSPLK